MLKIRQSYHGNGGREGYKYKVYDNNGRKLGEISDLPISCGRGDVVKLNNDLYEIVSQYDSDNPRHEKSEVVFYDLEPFEFKPKYDLGEIIIK